MAVQMPTRRPFGILDESRLQGLASAKNRQNAISSITSDKTSKLKSTFSSPVKRQHDLFADDPDTENLAPTTPFSPQKRSKGVDSTPVKPSQFFLADATLLSKPAPYSAPAPRLTGLLSPVGQRKKTFTASLNTSSISKSRGSPKHKRVGLLSRKRSSGSGTPFKRVDPPAFGKSSGSAAALPFSIDAALSGTISSYTPKSSSSSKTAPPGRADRSVPAGWMFEIHEDSPEEETANIMAHNTGTMDISSDDDGVTKRRNEERECGKENIPPPDHDLVAASMGGNMVGGSNNNSSCNKDRIESLAASVEEVTTVKTRRARYAVEDVDAMDDVLAQRSPLGDLRPADHYPDGLDGSSIHVFTEVVEKEEKVEHAGVSGEGEVKSAGPDAERGVPQTEEVTTQVALEEKISPIEDILGTEKGTVIDNAADGQRIVDEVPAPVVDAVVSGDAVTV